MLALNWKYSASDILAELQMVLFDRIKNIVLQEKGL